MIEWVVGSAGIAICTAICLGIYFGYRLMRDIQEKVENPLVQVNSQPPPIINVDTANIEYLIKSLPNKVLQSIQASANVKKGALGELIGYIELAAQYDRIIPIGNIMDFVCIKFSSENEEGHIDFVDIKTGKFARLSKEQKLLQQLVLDKKINFVKLTVDTQTVEK